MARDINASRDLLRLAAPALKFLAELNGCRGFVTWEDVEEAHALDGAALAAIVTHIADKLECIDDADVRSTLSRLWSHIPEYLMLAQVSPKEYASVSDAYQAFAAST